MQELTWQPATKGTRRAKGARGAKGAEGAKTTYVCQSSSCTERYIAVPLSVFGIT